MTDTKATNTAATNKTIKPDLKEAERFLAALAPIDVFCFQTFDDCPDRELRDKTLAWHHTGTFSEVKDWLVRANSRGAGVFVTLNPTDGLGRTKKNVTGTRAVLLDLDGAPLDPVRECALQPHIITETSEGHYHVLWLVDGFPLEQWEDVQRGLAKRFDGDPAVATLERCTRLPGFVNRKDAEHTFRVRIVAIDQSAAYCADAVLREFPPEKKAHAAARSADQIILPAGAPVVAAEEFIKHHASLGDTRLLHSYRGAFYRWTGSHYREYPDEALERDLYAFLNTALTQRKDSLGPFNPTKNKVLEVVHALRRGCLLSRDWDTPCWVGTPEYRPAANLVACRNGILNLETRELQPHDPLFFVTNCLPLDYDAAAPKPKRWQQFLGEIWPTWDKDGHYDAEAEETLQEIAGYLLTPDTRMQKIFLIIGPPRSGKGTIVSVLARLLGEENCVFPTLASMSGEFGRWPLIDKKLAAITDARISSRADTHRIAELLLSISGGDRQTINRKNQAFWTGYLNVRFLMTTNVLPAIQDASGTIATRYILLKLTESFLGREDLDLKAALAPEMGGILIWALDGLDRLRKRGYFRLPASSADLIRELEDAAEPVKAFLREWCEHGSDLRVNVKTFYHGYRAWAEEVGQQILAKNSFGRALRGQLPKLKTTGVGAKRDYVGVALSDYGEEQFDSLMEEKGRRR